MLIFLFFSCSLVHLFPLSLHPSTSSVHSAFLVRDSSDSSRQYLSHLLRTCGAPNVTMDCEDMRGPETTEWGQDRAAAGGARSAGWAVVEHVRACWCLSLFLSHRRPECRRVGAVSHGQRGPSRPCLHQYPALPPLGPGWLRLSHRALWKTARNHKLLFLSQCRSSKNL